MWECWRVAIEVIAHRGSNEEEPEHSLAAYLRAIDEGVDGVECDVRLTADGTLVLVHDRRINRTSSGTADRTLLVNPCLPAPAIRQLACPEKSAYLCLQQVRLVKKQVRDCFLDLAKCSGQRRSNHGQRPDQQSCQKVSTKNPKRALTTDRSSAGSFDGNIELDHN